MELDAMIRVVVTAGSASFPRPEFWRDEVSYDVMTPAAARGVLDRIHWRPAIRWVIDAISVLRPIRFREIGRGLSAEGARSVILEDVGYIIDAHFEMTSRAGTRDEPARHLGMFRRQIRKGAAIFLGSELHPGEVCLVEDVPDDRGEPINETRDLGWMVHQADYEDRRRLRFFRAEMVRGVVAVPSPNDARLFG